MHREVRSLPVLLDIPGDTSKATLVKDTTMDMTLAHHTITVPDQQYNDMVDFLNAKVKEQPLVPDSFLFSGLLDKGYTGKESYAVLCRWKKETNRA